MRRKFSMSRAGEERKSFFKSGRPTTLMMGTALTPRAPSSKHHKHADS